MSKIFTKYYIKQSIAALLAFIFIFQFIPAPQKAQADIMGQHILKYPDQWFWQHKRFKEYHKEIYKK